MTLRSDAKFGELDILVSEPAWQGPRAGPPGAVPGLDRRLGCPPGPGLCAAGWAQQLTLTSTKTLLTKCRDSRLRRAGTARP